MTSRRSLSLVALAGIALGVVGCGHTFGSAAAGATARVPLAPPGVFVDDDVANGYVAFASVLAPDGAWEGDANYGVHWCPARSPGKAAFHPYESNGHWSSAEQPAYGSPAGTVTWTSDNPGSWTDTTTHRGWWIERGIDDWCWVPGVRETPARVVWRSNDEFVGWAPEPPSWVDDGDEDATAGFDWVFELLGTLLEDVLDGRTLHGEAAHVAARATAPRHATSSRPGFTRQPPAKVAVMTAHAELVSYSRAHAAESTVATGAAARSTTASASTSSAPSSSGTSQNDAKADASSDDHLPPGPLFVVSVMSDPALVAAREAREAGAADDFGSGRAAEGSASGTTQGATAQLNRRTKTMTPAASSHSARASSYRSFSSGSSSSSGHTSSSGSSSRTSSSSSSHRR